VQHPDGECHEKRDFRNLARQLNVLVRIRTGSRHRRIRLALRRPQVAARGPHLSADPTSSVASVCAKLGAYRISRKIRPLCVCVCLPVGAPWQDGRCNATVPSRNAVAPLSILQKIHQSCTYRPYRHLVLAAPERPVSEPTDSRAGTGISMRCSR
jgi:hypothetical protein